MSKADEFRILGRREGSDESIRFVYRGVAFDQECFHVVAGLNAALAEAATQLFRIGYDRIVGVLDGGTAAWVAGLWADILRAEVANERADFFDLGGGSLELVDVASGKASRPISLPLGVFRAGINGKAVREAIREGIDTAGLKGRGRGRVLYLVGGSWRSLARMDMIATGYPLTVGYAISCVVTPCT